MHFMTYMLKSKYKSLINDQINIKTVYRIILDNIPFYMNLQ
jgi:hypothetical protein